MVDIECQNITLGYSCNNNCLHCVIGYGARKLYPDRSTSEIKSLLDASHDSSAKKVILIGGEATIRPDFFEILEYAKKLGLTVCLETNARAFCSEHFARKAMSIDPDLEVMASFHSNVPEIQDLLAGVKGSFYQSRKGILNLKKYGLRKLSADTVISRLNYKTLSDTAGFLKNLGVDESYLTLMRIEGNSRTNFKELFIPIKDFQENLFDALDLAERKGMMVNTYGFPYCTLGKHCRCAAERKLLRIFRENKQHIFNELCQRIDWQKERPSIKAKLKSCKSCRHFGICEGIWREYIEEGLLCGEINPVV